MGGAVEEVYEAHNASTRKQEADVGHLEVSRMMAVIASSSFCSLRRIFVYRGCIL